MCLCMLMHATMNHEGNQPASAPTATPTAAPSEGPLPPRPDVNALLDERYARGEIDRQEYLQRREDLSR
jgi:Short C-terminal domain